MRAGVSQRSWRERWLPVLAAGLTLGASGCREPKDATPEGAVRELVHASLAGNAVRAYELLSPAARRALKKQAELATAQTGGTRQIPPHELLAVSLEPARFELGRVELLHREGQRARVKLFAKRKKAEEVIELVRVGERWRVDLPVAGLDH